MPLVKFKFIVSSSDSVQGFEADNLLIEGRTRTKWKGKAGAVSNCVVIQLDREHSISSVDIGNEFSALVEILVAKSCEQQPAFHTLVPSSSLMDPMESRSEKNGNRVRMFTVVDMIPAVCKQKWDLLKVVCSQPFNPNLSYGLAFINMIGEEPKTKSADEMKVVLPKITFKEKSDKIADETMKAGSMFKQRHLFQTNQAEDSNPKLNDESNESKKRHTISDDDENCKRINTKEGDAEMKKMKNAINSKQNNTEHKKPKRTMLKRMADHSVASSSGTGEQRKTMDEQRMVEQRLKVESDGKHDETNARAVKDVQKKEEISSSSAQKATTSITKEIPFSQVLRGVRFSLSGYQNPQRSQLRDKARHMGADYEADWTPSCTHLICAFPNTPKWRQVGSSGIIVSEKWIEMCYMRKKRLPEKNFPVALQ